MMMAGIVIGVFGTAFLAWVVHQGKKGDEYYKDQENDDQLFI